MLQPTLPLSGRTPHARHASYLGAVASEPKAGSQCAQYLAYLRSRGSEGATDREAASALRLERSSINARRSVLMRLGLVVDSGRWRKGERGVANVIWMAV